MHQGSGMGTYVQRAAWIVVLALFTLPSSLAASEAEPWGVNRDTFCDAVDDLQFNGSEANSSVQWQVSLGPRVPESNASLAFRYHVNATLSEAGWEVEETLHARHGMNLTNIEARWPSSTSNGRQVVLAAHYDSRNIADKDLNKTNQSLPVPGANDGASGVAVLLELATIVPSLDLQYDVVLFLNDAEDQNQNFTVGAEAWAENLSEEEIGSTEAFVLLDMVGDADLQLRNINPGNDTLKERMVVLAEALGLVSDVEDCSGEVGSDIVQYDIEVGVLDDHYHAHVRNIPSIDIMDPEYGEPTPYAFGSLWHTMEDTPDKVSADSLAHVGRWVELGLRTDAFVNITPNEITTTDGGEENESLNPPKASGEDTGSERKTVLAQLALVMLVAVLLGLALLERSQRG
jgi:glutaminyl-peptide cyclotransferase